MTKIQKQEIEWENLTPYSHIDSSLNEIDKILKEYSKLVQQEDIRLFTTQQYAATTNQNILKDALVRTVDIDNEPLARRHKLAKDVLWLWLCVYCMKCMYKHYATEDPENFEARKEDYQSAIWDGIIEGINCSLSNFKAGNGRLKSYVYWMVSNRVLDNVKKNIWEKKVPFALCDDFDAVDPSGNTKKEEEIWKIFETFENKLNCQKKDIETTFDAVYGDLADYIRKNMDTYEMILRSMKGETLVKIGEHFDCSKDTVRNRINEFKKYICDNFC